jgi:micrococcal nuclease
MNDSSEHIEKAIAEAKSGNKAGAKKILAQVVRQEPGNAQAWYVLSRLVEEKEQIIYCLNQVLKIAPDSSQAKARLKKLQASPAAKPATDTQGKVKNRSGMIVLIGSGCMLGFCLILAVLYLGIHSLGFFTKPTPTTTFSQALNQKDAGVNPVLAFPDTPESQPSDGISALPTDLATATSTPSPTPNPTHTPQPVLSGASACIPLNAQSEVGQVLSVIDGDTIEVLINGQTYRVRYIGIDSPETGSEPFGAEAVEKNKELVDGKEIILVKDTSETDPFGRLLRYVFAGDLGGVFVNDELVESGYASASAYPPDTACEETFASAERNARSQELGLWAPVPILLPTNPPTLETSGNCDPAYPEVCIPSPPPDLDCKDIQFRRFRVLQPDPHNFDRDQDGIGCESQ